MNLWLQESLKSLEIYSKIICADYCDWLSFRGATCRSWILCSRKVSGGEEYIKQTSNRESDNNAIVSKRDSFCVELTLEIFSLGFVIQGVSSSLITGCVDSSGFKWSPGWMWIGKQWLYCLREDQRCSAVSITDTKTQYL